MPTKPFRLETYLKICRQRLDEARLELLESQKKLDELNQQRAALIQQKDAEIARLDSCMCHSICAGALEENYRYTAWIDQQIAAVDRNLAKATAEADERGRALIEANIEVKKFEKLKEKATDPAPKKLD